jgi:uncharacterized protein YdeI (YjbR/CyaY-like superfamily)
MEPKFFATPAAWRDWLVKNHGKHTELLVGFYKKGSGKASITWPEAVDGALCFGWIDSVRRRIDDKSYSNRFTPRKPSSNWSAININLVEKLIAAGQMHPAGLKAFQARTEKRSRIYSFEQERVEFEDAQERRFKANRNAWKYFQSRPLYRRAATWWVIGAKREETKEKRLATLIETSERGETLRQYTRRKTL